MKILVVDDNLSNMKLMRVVLQQQGYEVMEATNGSEGLSCIRKELPNLVLMDIQMPVIDGIEALNRIKADPASSHLPVVALTSYAMKGDREKFLDLGFVDYIPKPVDIDVLIEVVEKYVMRG